MTPAELIHSLGLDPHPEGGWYRRLFTSPLMMETTTGPRPSMTCIHYLLTSGEFSAWHRLTSHELWHWQAGGNLWLHRLDPHGRLETQLLGPDGTLTLIIAPNTWFAAEPALGSQFALITCSVTPGFDFADFELARREALVNLYPRHLDMICRLTREG